MQLECFTSDFKKDIDLPHCASVGVSHFEVSPGVALYGGNLRYKHMGGDEPPGGSVFLAADSLMWSRATDRAEGRGVGMAQGQRAQACALWEYLKCLSARGCRRACCNLKCVSFLECSNHIHYHCSLDGDLTLSQESARTEVVNSAESYATRSI